MKLPKLGDSISDAIIATLHKKEGEFVKVDDVVATVETEKVTVEIRSEVSGTITKCFVKEQDKIDVGADFIEFDTDGKPSADASSEKKVEGKAEPKEIHEKAKETASGPLQTQQDTPSTKKSNEQPMERQDKTLSKEKVTEAGKAQPSIAFSGNKSSAPNVQFSGSRTERREPMKRIRQRISERLKGSQNTYATLTTFNECDMGEVMAMRQKYQEEFNKKHGIKLGFMSFFLKAATEALMASPVMNAVIDGNDIIYRDYIDISVAVATPTGLMVPVIRNCESKSLADFEKILRDLSIAARDNKINVEDMVGGTFTVSNGGVYGSMLGTPIINPPQSSILGMHNIVNRPVVRGEQIVARPIMYLALSYDHRLIDGREGVLFLKKIKDLVEEPQRMLMNL